MSAAVQHTLAGSATLEGTSLHTGAEGHPHAQARAGRPRLQVPPHRSARPAVHQCRCRQGPDRRARHDPRRRLGQGPHRRARHFRPHRHGRGQRAHRDGRQRAADRRRLVAALRRTDQESRHRRRKTAPRKVWEIREPIHQETGDGTIITIVPCKTFSVSVTNVGPEGRFTQYFSSEVTPELYEKEICAARTFVYYEDVKPLLEKGLIKGGSLESAVVIRGNEIMSKEAMRFHQRIRPPQGARPHRRPDAFRRAHPRPRHRGETRPRPEHQDGRHAQSANTPACARWCPRPSSIPDGESVLDINEVLKILPHRYPFLMVDRIVDCVGDSKCTGDQERHHQRALLPRPLPRPPDHARRAPARSHGPGLLACSCSASRRTPGKSATS